MRQLAYTIAWAVLTLGQLAAQSAESRIKVYLLGTFHFGDTDTSIFDIKTRQNQQEIQQLCRKIETFRPDRVFIERQPDFEYQSKMDSFYQAYRMGDTLRRRNEIWQVAFRVASHLNHDSIYQCDHPGNYGNLYGEIEAYANTHNQQDVLAYKARGTTRPMHMEMDRDSLFRNSGLTDILKLLNSKEYQARSHASYINMFPQLGNTNVYKYDANYLLGADLTVDWYRRNIKIYTKMINQLDYTEKAIFLIIGNDHVPILRHLFESNPYFEVMDTEAWLGQ